MTPLFITTKEASQLLSISVRAVQDLCASNIRGFPAVRFGKRYLINAELLENWAKEQAQEGGILGG